MPTAASRVDALIGQSNPKVTPSGAVPVPAADRLTSRSSTGPVGSQRVRVLGAHCALVLLAALGIAGSGSALASDGVLEINQACAVQTGCFAGDTVGLPVTINASGSYRLTSNLEMPNENISGIQVSADNVSIDLAGFEIRGVTVCSGTPLDCAPKGMGAGVSKTSGTEAGISVRNGSIRGMGGSGVELGPQSELMHLRVRSNGANGIFTGSDSIVSGITAFQNGLEGFQIAAGSTVSGNTASQNGTFGFVVQENSIVSGNTARDNGGDGIYAGSGSTMSNNSAYSNGGNGIYTAVGSTVSGNTAFDNDGDGIQANQAATVSGNTAFENGSDGIQANVGSTVWGNTVRSNTVYGLNLGSESGYRENVISNNQTGTVNGGVDMGNNLCDGGACTP